MLIFDFSSCIFFQFDFDYFICISIVGFSILTNLFLQFKIKDNQLNNVISTVYLTYDILQLGVVFFFTGGVTNPFIFLIIIPAVFSSQYLHFYSSIILVMIIILVLFILSFYYYDLPHPGELHFHVPNYYFFAIQNETHISCHTKCLVIHERESIP